MPKTSENWRKWLEDELQDDDFAAGYIVDCVRGGVGLEEALEDVIRARGVKEFAERIRMKSPALIRIMKQGSNPTRKTLQRMLAPFGLELSVRKIRKRQRVRRPTPRRRAGRQ